MRKKLIWMTVCVGVGFILLTVAMSFYFSSNMESAKVLINQFAASAQKAMGEDGAPSFIAVVINNLFACAIAMGLGIIPFLFLPLISIISNAAIIGALLGLSSAAGIMSPLRMIVIGLLPHGIFELPAIFLSMAMGIYLCKTLTLKILGRDKEEKLMDVFNGLAKIFVLVIIPLLIVASAVECTITPMLINRFGMN